MLLTKISYKSDDWELSELELGKVNLIVGQNAVGKSRTLEAIASFVGTLNGKVDIDFIEEYTAEFIDADSSYEYCFEVGEFPLGEDENEPVEVFVKEIFSYSSSAPSNLIEREYDKVIFLNEIDNSFETRYIPFDKSALAIGEDPERYPIVSKFIHWLSNIYVIRFIGKQIGMYDDKSLFEPYGVEEKLIQMLKTFTEDQFESLNQEINKVGFNINEIQLNSIALRMYYISIHEGENEFLLQKLSVGLRRTISLLIYLEYLSSKKKPSTLIIDDFCEGLDYERAAKLGKLVFEKCENSNIQLIAASNDSFLMDVIDIKHWNILQRNGSKVTAINERNSPEIFEKFRFIGLSNFDLLSSDFLQRHANE